MNLYKLFFTFLFILTLSIFSCKEPGCTDINALNYNSEANKDDNSCIYNSNLNINFRLVDGNTSLSKYDTIFNENLQFIKVCSLHAANFYLILKILKLSYMNPPHSQV